MSCQIRITPCIAQKLCFLFEKLELLDSKLKNNDNEKMQLLIEFRLCVIGLQDSGLPSSEVAISLLYCHLGSRNSEITTSEVGTRTSPSWNSELGTRKSGAPEDNQSAPAVYAKKQQLQSLTSKLLKMFIENFDVAYAQCYNSNRVLSTCVQCFEPFKP